MGAGLWPTSKAWVEFVESSAFRSVHAGCAKSQRLLELGSGHGLCGLSCGMVLNWATIVMTDKVSLLTSYGLGCTELVVFLPPSLRTKSQQEMVFAPALPYLTSCPLDVPEPVLS